MQSNNSKVALLTMFKVVFAVLLAAWAAEGRGFNNPILDNADYPDPGAIKVDGVYYIVTTTNNREPNKYPIHRSTDLNNWELAGYVFTAETIPSWTNQDKEFWAPEIHRINNRFHVYFTSRDVAANRLCIGVATADNVLGPYRSPDRPIYLTNEDCLDSSIINDNGNLYFLWKSGPRSTVYGRPLNPDGLTFPSDQITPLFVNDLPWEDTIVEAPWYVRHGDYHYLFYSGHDYCSELYRVGIARSRSPLGPYEKRGDPILASNNRFKGPGHNSVVKDLNGVDDVIIFHGFKDGQICAPWPRLTFVASVGWGADNWPYIYDWN